MIGALTRQTLKALTRAPLSQLITIALIAASASLLVASLTVAFNLERLSQRWEEGGELLVVLSPGLPEARYVALSDELKSWPELQALTLTTPIDAQRDIIDALGSDTFEVGASLEALPGTFELRLVRPQDNPLTAQLRARLLDLEGVQEVASVTEGEGLLAQLYTLRQALKGWLWVLGLWVGVSVAFVITQLVRLSLLQRQLELEVWVSVGASELLILGPLMCEAALQVGLGVWLALSLIDEVVLSAARAGSESLKLLQLELTPLPLWAHFVLISLAAALGALSSWRVARATLRARG